jgi:hypothetical protein
VQFLAQLVTTQAQFREPHSLELTVNVHVAGHTWTGERLIENGIDLHIIGVFSCVSLFSIETLLNGRRRQGHFNRQITL